MKRIGKLLCRIGIHKVYRQTIAVKYCLRPDCDWEYLDMEKLWEYDRKKHGSEDEPVEERE